MDNSSNTFAIRAASVPVVAAYTGNKVKDLVLYVRGLEPKLYVWGRSPGKVNCTLTDTEAYSLASKLLRDGWVGWSRQSKEKDKNGVPKYGSIVYGPDESSKGRFSYTPTVQLFKPSLDSDKGVWVSQVTLTHATRQSETERIIMWDLNHKSGRHSMYPKLRSKF
jgi:hypothetical protein